MKDLMIAIGAAFFSYTVLSWEPIKSRLEAISFDNPDISSTPMPFTVRDDGEIERLLRIDQEKEKERLRILAKKKDYLENWSSNIRCDYKNGDWTPYLLGGGFRDVKIMVYNDGDITVDEVKVRFKVKKRDSDYVCYDEVHTFTDLKPNTAQSINASKGCGMRPPSIGIMSFKVNELDIDKTNLWDVIKKANFMNNNI